MVEPSLGQDFCDFFSCLARYSKLRSAQFFRFFEQLKSYLAAWLYQQRGRYARPFIHLSMAFLVAGGVSLGPVLISEKFHHSWQGETPGFSTLSVAAAGMETATLVSAKPRADIVNYQVKTGDTLSTIAKKFGISVDTIRWENNLKSAKAIKVGQKLKILPVTGVVHKVKHGETIYSIAKKYRVDAQAIVNWPYNSFANDETFALAVGQMLIIPDGIKPKEAPTVSRRLFAKVPAAGTVTGTGQFAWPTNGVITQGYRWYHRAIDIANPSAPNVVAADTGTVIVAGWPHPWAYGNRIIINHGNGYKTLYAHLSRIYVKVGQTVKQGQVIGRMGTTGRSTGTHLHFEIRKNNVPQNPFNYLK